MYRAAGARPAGTAPEVRRTAHIFMSRMLANRATAVCDGHHAWIVVAQVASALKIPLSAILVSQQQPD